jgi:hypothetical protein
MHCSFRVPPKPKYRAEVVLLITSLGVKRKEYNSSRQAMEKLEIFRSHFKIIDFNIDTGGDEFGAGSKPDLDTVRRLYQSHRVKQDSEDGMISLPQIIIDGVNVGDHMSLQRLMDDGLLAGILKQEVCPHCFEDRSGEYCYKCKTLLQEVMPKRQTMEDLLRRLKFQRIPFKSVDFEDDEEEEEDERFANYRGEDSRFAA